RDTYNHRTANQYLWETVGQRPQAGNSNDYKNMYEFWKGMNAFRLSDYGKVFRVAAAVDENYYQWITPTDESLLGYIVDNKVMVLLNAGDQKNSFKQIKLPEGNWKLIANTNAIDHIKGVPDDKKIMQLKGGQMTTIKMQATSILIWVKE
ncbi:MAG: pullulanase, partial [Saprospiraceae bacterium]